MTPRVALEVCAGGIDCVLAAERGGADRVELCAGLSEGGTTPSLATIALARERSGIDLNVMVRPRGGDFCYTAIEFEVMKRDVAAARDAGAGGVAFGILRLDGAVDVERTAELVALARPCRVTFHRAVDVCRDPLAALEDLVRLGADRVLSSGQAATAIEGLTLLAEIVRRAAGRIRVVACGGVNAANVRRIVEGAGVHEVHVGSGAHVWMENPARVGSPRVSFAMGGGTEDPRRRVVSAESVAAIVRELGSGSTTPARASSN